MNCELPPFEGLIFFRLPKISKDNVISSLAFPDACLNRFYILRNRNLCTHINDMLKNRTKVEMKS